MVSLMDIKYIFIFIYLIILLYIYNIYNINTILIVLIYVYIASIWSTINVSYRSLLVCVAYKY